jgi:hypothetical protein
MSKKASKPRAGSARSAKAGAPPRASVVPPRVRRRQRTAIAAVRKRATIYESPAGARPAPTKLPRSGPKR